MIVNSFRRRAAICAADTAVVGALCVGVPIAHADDQYLGDLGANDMQNFCNKFSYYPSTAQVKRVDIGWECWPNDPNPFIQRIDVDFSVCLPAKVRRLDGVRQARSRGRLAPVLHPAAAWTGARAAKAWTGARGRAARVVRKNPTGRLWCCGVTPPARAGRRRVQRRGASGPSCQFTYSSRRSISV